MNQELELADPDMPAALATPVRLSRIEALLDRLPMTVFWALAGQAILSITRLLTSMTIGGRFGPGSEVQLGYYSTAFGVLLTLIGLHEAFVTTPLTVFQPSRKPGTEKSFAGNMLMISLIWASIVVVGAIGLFAIGPVLSDVDSSLMAVLIAMTSFAPLQMIREFSRRWMLSQMLVCSSALFEFLYASLFITSLSVLISLARVDAVSIFATIGCINAVCLGVWWSRYQSRFELSKPELKPQLMENLRYGRWVAGENFSSTVMMYFCNFFLLAMIDEASAGVFFACFTIVLLANPFLLGICSILAPKAASAFTDGGWPLLMRTLIRFGCFITAVLASFAAVMWFFGDGITNLFFGPRYASFFDARFEGVNRVTSILGLAMPLLGISFVVTTGLLAANRPYDSFYAAVVGLLVMVVANFSFADPNLETAAISFLFSAASTMLFRLFCLVRAIRCVKPPRTPTS